MLRIIWATRIAMLPTYLLCDAFISDDIPSEENYFAPEFRWERLSYNSFMLIWKTAQLAERGVDQIDVLVEPKHRQSHKVHKNASVEDGEVIVEGLKPNTLYAVIVRALAHGSTVLTYRTLFKSWPTGKFHSNDLIAFARMHTDLSMW